MNITPLGIFLGLLPFVASVILGLVLARFLGISGKKRVIMASCLTILIVVLPQTAQIFSLQESLFFELGVFFLISTGAGIGLVVPMALVSEVLLQKIPGYMKDK